MPETKVPDRLDAKDGPDRDEPTPLQEAERTNQLKDEFLATLSHELRTPLNAILGWTQLLLTRQLSPADTDRALRTIRRNAESQARLIEDILDVSRLVAGKLRLNPRPTRLAAVIRAAVETARPAAEARRITVRVHSTVEDDWIVGDPDRLEQVTWNLVSNAVKFTPPGGTIEVKADIDERWAEIRVQDNGAGIAPQFLPSLFERFRQADPSTTRSHGGLGLGLALVRHLVELHGGTVRAQSEGKGKGATFVVRFPAGPGAACLADTGGPRRELTPDRRVPRLPSLEGIRVVIVDRHPYRCEEAILALERLGARVEKVSAPGEAVATVARQRPDVLLVHVERNEHDGYALARRIRELQERTGQRLPAAAMATCAEPSDEDWAAAAGFDACVAWPAAPEVVALAVARLAGRTGAR